MTEQRAEADVVREITAQAVAPDELEPGKVYAVPREDGAVRILDTDEWAEHPRRQRADRVVYDAASFAQYLARHATDATEVYADVQSAQIVAVLDSHELGAPGWEKHRITLALTKSPSWEAWKSKSGALMGQQEFAEFIELNAADVREPSSTDLLDLAQTFEATKAVEYESSERLGDGQTRLRYKETVQAKAGQRGDLDIPSQIVLGVKPYIGSPTYSVIARFRYRIDPSTHALRLGYVLERTDLILDNAFEDIVTLLRTGRTGSDAEPWTKVEAVAAPIFLGRP